MVRKILATRAELRFLNKKGKIINKYDLIIQFSSLLKKSKLLKNCGHQTKRNLIRKKKNMKKLNKKNLFLWSLRINKNKRTTCAQNSSAGD